LKKLIAPALFHVSYLPCVFKMQQAWRVIPDAAFVILQPRREGGMAGESKGVFEFGEFRLDSTNALLTRLGTPVSLAPKVFDVLVYLVSNAGRLIDKEELLKALWPDTFVEEANLTVNIAALRRALGTQSDGQSWIETVPKRGYRFLGSVMQPDATPPAADHSPALRPNFKYIRLFAGLAILSIAVAGYYLYSRKPSGTAPRRQSIAVLPFQDLSSGTDELRTGLGMTDALVTKLGELPEISARSIETVRRFDGSGVDPLEVGRQLGVDTVLTGSVQRLDKRIRVSVRLLRVQDGQALWADKFDELLTNVFAVQDAISEKLAHTLALRLTSEDQDRMMRRYTENTEAFRLYELGRYAWFSDIPKATEYYQRSIREDPRYALPYVELAKIYLVMSGDGGGAFPKYAPLAREAAARALSLAPDLADAHVATADVQRGVDWDYKGAEREIEIATRLNPGSAKVHGARSVLLAMQGDLTAAIPEARMAMSLDPFNGRLAVDLGWLLYCNHQYDATIEWLDEFKRRDSRSHLDWDRFFSYLKLSRTTEAIAILEAEIRSQGSSPAINAALIHAFLLTGRSKEALELMKSLPDDSGFYQRAVIEIAMGNLDAAFTYLDRAVEERSLWIKWLKVDPDLEPLHADPRFAKVVARLGLVPWN
jgi:DNA-binding winged helix-turn-helix (wHTH) protein/TolB-like protein